jgi:hypothetical protein
MFSFFIILLLISILLQKQAKILKSTDLYIYESTKPYYNEEQETFKNLQSFSNDIQSTLPEY